MNLAMSTDDNPYSSTSVEASTGNPYTGDPSGFKSFGSPEEGRNALLNQLERYQTGKTKFGIGPNSTLLQAMSTYAPSSDGNNPLHYAHVVAKIAGVDINTPISKIDRNKWADAITKMEGNKHGNNPGNLRKGLGGIQNVIGMFNKNYILPELINQYKK